MRDQDHCIVAGPNRKRICIHTRGIQQANCEEYKTGKASNLTILSILDGVFNADLADDWRCNRETRSNLFSIFCLEQIAGPESYNDVVRVAAT